MTLTFDCYIFVAFPVALQLLLFLILRNLEYNHKEVPLGKKFYQSANIIIIIIIIIDYALLAVKFTYCTFH